MGWRHAQLGAKAPPGRSSSRATVSTTAKAKLVSMTGVLGIDVASYQKNVELGELQDPEAGLRLRQGHRGQQLPQPVLQLAVQRRSQSRTDPRCVPLREPERSQRQERRPTTSSSTAVPGRATARHCRECWTSSTTRTAATPATACPRRRWSPGSPLSSPSTRRKTTRDAVIYTTADWWKRCTGNTTKFNQTNPLWVARYGTSSPGTLPGKWPFYTFWQYSSSPHRPEQVQRQLHPLAGAGGKEEVAGRRCDPVGATTAG